MKEKQNTLPTGTTVKDVCNKLREEMKPFLAFVKNFKEDMQSRNEFEEGIEGKLDKSEMIANAMLAYRHLE